MHGARDARIAWFDAGEELPGAFRMILGGAAMNTSTAKNAMGSIRRITPASGLHIRQNVPQREGNARNSTKDLGNQTDESRFPNVKNQRS